MSYNVVAVVAETATKPSCFAHCWQGAESLVPATQNDTWTSKSAPNCSFFSTFDFEMCFAPQRRALFRHLNFQECSEPVSLLHFWLPNALCATTACTFRHILTRKCASRHKVQFFISHLARCLRTRRFSEPTFFFDPPEPQIIRKTQWIVTFLPFRAVYHALAPKFCRSPAPKL